MPNAWNAWVFLPLKTYFIITPAATKTFVPFLKSLNFNPVKPLPSKAKFYLAKMFTPDPVALSKKL